MNISERKKRLTRSDVIDNMNYSQICRRKTNIPISQKEIEKPSYEKINHNQRYSLVTTDYQNVIQKNHINPKEKKYNNPYRKINQSQPVVTKTKVYPLKNLNLTRKIIYFQTPEKKREENIYTIPQTRTDCEINDTENNYNENRNNNNNNNNFIYTLVENDDEEQNINNSNNNINRKNSSVGIKRSYSCAQRDKYKKSNGDDFIINNPDIFIKKKARDEFRQSFLLNNTDNDIREHSLEKNINNFFYTENNINILNTTDDGNNNILNNNIYKKINPKAHINFFNLNMNFNVNYNDNIEHTNNNTQNQRTHSVGHRKINKNNDTRFNHHQINNSIEVKMVNTFDKEMPINILNNNINIMKNKENNLKYNMNNDITKKANKNNKNNNYSLINLEDFLFVIHKLDSIKNLLIFFIKNSTKISSKNILECINNIRIKTYDLFTFYMSCSFEGMPQNYLLSNKDSKNYMSYFTIIFILCLGIIYIITHKIKMTKDYQDKLLKLINLQEKSFLVLCEEIIEKNKINEKNYILNEIITEINKKNIASNYNNHILHIKILSIESYKIINDILFNLYTFADKSKRNSQEAFMYKQFHNKDMTTLSKMKIYDIEEIFYKNIFKVINLRSNYANITSVQGISKNNILKNYNTNYTNVKMNETNKIKIPFLDFKPKKEYTLVLDLDETMISFNFIEMEKGVGKMHIRPGLEEFLSVIRDYYEIIVFTSGTKDYADTILDIIEQKKNTKYFSGRLYREHTIQIGQKYIKDLSKLGRDLSKTLIVDNLPHSFKLQRENGILIKSFFADNKNDKVLFELQRILINIFYDKTDVRKSIIKYREDILKNVSCIDDDYYY